MPYFVTDPYNLHSNQHIFTRKSKPISSNPLGRNPFFLQQCTIFLILYLIQRILHRILHSLLFCRAKNLKFNNNGIIPILFRLRLPRGPLSRIKKLKVSSDTRFIYSFIASRSPKRTSNSSPRFSYFTEKNCSVILIFRVFPKRLGRVISVT